MSFGTTVPREDYTGNGTTAVYSYGFRIFEGADLKLTALDLVGNEYALTYTTDYTVTGVNNFSGGSITLVRSDLLDGSGFFKSGWHLSIRYGGATKQDFDLRNQGGLFPESIEDAIDRVCRYLQKVEDVANRSLHFPETEGTSFYVGQLVTAMNRANKYLAFDSAGNPILTAITTAVGTSVIATGGNTSRTIADQFGQRISVRDFGTYVNGSTSFQAAIAAAVAYCYANTVELFWPSGTYLSTATIPNFHDVRHLGPGTLVRGASTWKITPARATVRNLYVGKTGADTNDGFTASEPVLTIQKAIDLVATWGPVVGRQIINIAAGTYGEYLTIPWGLSMNNNYLEFLCPSAPGLRGDPTTWPGTGVILDGTGMPTNQHGLNVRGFNHVEVEYMCFKNWYDAGLGPDAQVLSAIHCEQFSNTYFVGCSAVGNGLSNLYIDANSNCVYTGGILSGSRYSLNNVGGTLSLSSDKVTNYTTIKLARGWGLYNKHTAITVMDGTEFLDNGTAVGNDFGAIFCYEASATVDPRACIFKRNQTVYSCRHGGINRNTSDPDILGSGADANNRVWYIRGAGYDDAMMYKTMMPRDFGLTTGGGTVTTGGGAAALALDVNATLTAAYLMDSDQYLEFEVQGINNAGGTAQCKPSLYDASTATRYELGDFLVAASTRFYIHIILQPTSGGLIATCYYNNIAATTGGAVVGQNIINPITFDSKDLEFQVWGTTTAANVLTINRARMLVWG